MQSSINISDGTGSEILTALNNALQTIASGFIGSSEPEVTYAGQFWTDTSATNHVVKQRNNANSDWVTIGTIVSGEFQPSNALLNTDSTITKQGNTFNGVSQLVKLNSSGKLPMLDGSLLTGISLPTRVSTNKFLVEGSEHTKIKIIAGTNIEVPTTEGKKLFQCSSDAEYSVPTILDTGTLAAGKDYSIFLCLNAESGLDVKCSLNATAPSGVAVADCLRIGGFHTHIKNITSANAPAANHPSIGYNANEIVSNSVWCLTHRPISSPNGMAYVDLLDLWADIYPQSGKEGNPTSVYGATACHSRQWEDHADDMRLVGKRFPWDHEYSVLGMMANERTAVAGAAQPNPDTTGGHSDTAGKLMISKYNLWETQGLRWCWLSNVSSNGGSGWTNHDSLAGAKGGLYGSSLALLAGGDWAASSSCGSRSRAGDSSRAAVNAYCGGRGVSLPLFHAVIAA